jgi:hypothetical protein
MPEEIPDRNLKVVSNHAFAPAYSYLSDFIGLAIAALMD